jgi:hypothetical protein
MSGADAGCGENILSQGEHEVRPYDDFCTGEPCVRPTENKTFLRQAPCLP